MSIRSTVKAISIHNGQILLNACRDEHNGEYYSLPGGGQEQYETLHDALIRECLEETGYTVIPVRFAALCETICVDEGIRCEYPDYAHKMYHIFVCELSADTRKTPPETDDMQVCSEWVDTNRLNNIRLLPNIIGKNILSIISGGAPVFLGSEIIDFNHG